MPVRPAGQGTRLSRARFKCEPSGAKCREIVAENRPHFAPNFMRRISRADFYPLIALLCPLLQT